MAHYCEIAAQDPLHQPYHDEDYGVPQTDESVLLERLALEINQAGLNWALMLKKRAAFWQAYEGFDPEIVARYGAADEARLRADAGIIRNRLKIRALIHNAGVVLALRESHGGFAGWLDQHHPRPLRDWLPLFRQHFRFIGPEIVNEFLMSLGYLPGAHHPTCPCYTQLRDSASPPPWMQDAALIARYEAGAYDPFFVEE